SLYADAEGKAVVTRLSLPAPRDDEILVKVLYSGVNPSDFRTLKFFDCRRRVLGNEFCGKVLESPGLANSTFKAGDVVAGYTDGSNNRPERFGTHQEYISIPPAWAFQVPENVPHPNAAALPVVVQTANDALFNRFQLPLPQDAKGPIEGTMVIWGGATSVGMAAIQLARASGITSIIVTASPKRHEFLKKLGATHCFDYNDEDTVASIKALILQSAGDDGRVWGFDAVGTISTPSSQTLLASSIPSRSGDRVRLVTVLIMPQEGFEPCVGARHYQVAFDLPNGRKIDFPPDMEAADRMWKALRWVVDHYGKEFQETPIRIFEGTAEDALEEVAKVETTGTFGKLVLAQPWVVKRD
ncbi:chaperonin 10-like protein, partial [Emericellopsis atlantica]